MPTVFRTTNYIAPTVQQTITTPASGASSVQPNGGSRLVQTADAATPVYWFEKGIAWQRPDLTPVGAIDFSSIGRVESAHGFMPVDPSIFTAMPLGPYDMPLFSAPVYLPGTYINTFYHVWTTRPVQPMVWPTLCAMRIGTDGFLRQAGTVGGQTVFPVSILGHNLVVDTPSGRSKVVLRYAAYVPRPPDPYGTFTNAGAVAATF